MGCETVITGLRAEIVTHLISSGIEFEHHAEFKGTLQLALNDIIFNKNQL